MMRCRSCLRCLRLPPRRITAWRLLYIPTCVFIAGLVYVHMMLLDNMRSQYYVIDGVSDGRSVDVQTTGTQAQWADLQHVSRRHSVLKPFSNKSGTGEIPVKPGVGNESSTKVLSVQLGHRQLIALNGNININGVNISEHIIPIGKGSHNSKGDDSIATGIKHNYTLSRKPSPSSQGTGIPFLKAWEEKTVWECGGRFMGYSGNLVQLTEVLVIRSLATAEASGGEDIMSVINRPESSESYAFTPGFFMLPCPEGILRSRFQPDKRKGFLTSWYDALVFDGPNHAEPVTAKPPKVVKPLKNMPIKNKPNNNGQVNNRPINNKLNNDRPNNNQPNNNRPNNNKPNNNIQNNHMANNNMPNNNTQNNHRANNNMPNNNMPNNNRPNKLGRRLLGVNAKGRNIASIGNNIADMQIDKPVSNNKTDKLRVINKKTGSKIPAQTKTKNIKAINITELVPPGSELKDNRFTIAITRYEYANLYWALVDMYDAFLTLTHFGYTPQTTQILFLDAKPWSHMDPLWSNFFGDVTRLAELPRAVRFHQMVWSFQRAHSPMLERQPLHLHANFRTQMLGAFNVTEPLGYSDGRYGKNCSSVGTRRLNVLFVWRHNYVAHPRNPSGVVPRKIANEAELLNATVKTFPGYNVRGEQLDKLDMREQVTIISDTDIMIGMHGAAFTFAWFLPKGSGVVEMFPANGAGNWHMRHIAESNGVHYDVWKNTNPKNELFHSKSTIIPPDVVIGLIRDMVETICTNKKKVTTSPPKKVANVKRNQQQRPKKPAARPNQAKRNVNAKVSKVNNNVKHQGAQPIPQVEHRNQQGVISDNKLKQAITPRPMGLQMPPQMQKLQHQGKIPEPKDKIQAGMPQRKPKLPALKQQWHL